MAVSFNISVCEGKLYVTMKGLYSFCGNFSYRNVISVCKCRLSYQVVVELCTLNTCPFRFIIHDLFLVVCRNFQYKHLAQIKYILPEAILIDKILIHDKETLCMRPDVKITLLFDGIDVHPEHSRFMALRERFASRLEDFVSAHPQVLC